MIAMRTVICATCNGQFEVERKRGRPRRTCNVCAGPSPAPRALKQLPIAPGLKLDPPSRPDGRCVVCRKERKVTEKARKYAGAQLDMDPFCSTVCCRLWHGCELTNAGTAAQTEGGKTRAAMERAERGWDDLEDEDEAA